MRLMSARRWLAGLGAVGALVVAAAPALAQPGPVEFGVYQPNTTVVAGGDGRLEQPILFSSATASVEEPTVTFDASGLAGVATVAAEEGSSDCTTPEPDELVCSKFYDIELDEWGAAGYFSVVIKAAAGADEGDSGELKVTFSGRGVAPVSYVSTVRVGEGVDLAAGPELELTGRPGDAFTAPLALHNPGDTTADGAVAVFYNDYGLSPVDRHANCTYEGDELRTCRFDAQFAPGGAYGADVDYRIAPDTFAPGFKAGEILWLTPAEYEDFVAYLDSLGVSVGRPGDGAELSMAELSGSRARRVQADSNPDNNWTYVLVEVQGKNGADLVAVGDTLSGAAGDVVTATVGLVNEGPATLDASRSGEPLTRIDVRVPPGTTATGVPEHCAVLVDGAADGELGNQPGHPAYRCSTSYFLQVGSGETVEFQLRIDEVVPDARGSVTINAKCECSGIGGDLDTTNDVADLLVNPTGGTGGGDGDGGGLPITGPAAASMAAAGLALLIAGVVGFVVARRRKVRFIA